MFKWLDYQNKDARRLWSYSSIISRTVVDTFSLELSFQMSSGFSWVPSNICTAASALSRMASMKTPGRKRIRVRRTCEQQKTIKWVSRENKKWEKKKPQNTDKQYFALQGRWRLTFGPTSLSEVILEKSSAVCVRTWGCVQLQKRSSK